VLSIKNKLTKMELRIKKLKEELISECQHEEVIHESYADDTEVDFLQRTYTEIYHCHDCGSYVTSNNKTEAYEKLKNTYDNQKRKST
jgi:ribosomal protein L37AE/L43A